MSGSLEYVCSLYERRLLAVSLDVTHTGWIEQLPNQPFSDASTLDDACITEQTPISALGDIFPEIRASQGPNLKDASFALVAQL